MTSGIIIFFLLNEICFFSLTFKKKSFTLLRSQGSWIYAYLYFLFNHLYSYTMLKFFLPIYLTFWSVAGSKAQNNSVFNPFLHDTLKICSEATTVLDAGAGYNQYLWSNGANS